MVHGVYMYLMCVCMCIVCVCVHCVVPNQHDQWRKGSNPYHQAIKFSGAFGTGNSHPLPLNVWSVHASLLISNVVILAGMGAHS